MINVTYIEAGGAHRRRQGRKCIDFRIINLSSPFFNIIYLDRNQSNYAAKYMRWEFPYGYKTTPRWEK